MYHLITGLMKLLTKKDEYNVLIIGLDDAGKSTVKNFKLDIFWGQLDD
jgi:ADP-ribosylation factor related protein 1